MLRRLFARRPPDLAEGAEMPYAEIGREITRGTICRDRWRADVMIACSDRVLLGRAEPLALRIRWRASEGGGELGNRPEDARPIKLQLRKASEASTGAIRFERDNGPEELEFSTDVD